ncbi:MAG: dephospho-CoA kinase [Hungatella sp.]|nr:dephospho-CoA kinase [Hungatella sp.]
MTNNHLIALTGGVGSGKSRILELLVREYKADVIQTDLVARGQQEPGNYGFHALVQYFGQEIVGGDGYLRKDRLSAMVFGDKEARERINRLIHPLVWEQVNRWAAESDSSLMVVESAVLPENPGDFFDEVWYVYTLKECRIRRLMESRGYSKEQCLRMMEGQASEEEFRRWATHIIDNNGSMEDVRTQVEAILRPLTGETS